jgi:uncharacterized membrane protein YidH (DUF202 family)
MIHTEFLKNQADAAAKLAAQNKPVKTDSGGASVTGFNAVNVAGAAKTVDAKKSTSSGFTFEPSLSNVPFVLAVGLVIWFFFLKK